MTDVNGCNVPRTALHVALENGVQILSQILLRWVVVKDCIADATDLNAQFRGSG